MSSLLHAFLLWFCRHASGPGTNYTCILVIDQVWGPFASPEPTVLLACGRDRELWLVQRRKCVIHVKSRKSDWLRIRNRYSAYTQKIGSSQSSWSQPQARRIIGSGDENGVKSRWLDIGLFFCMFMNRDRVKLAKKKEEANIQPPCPNKLGK